MIGIIGSADSVALAITVAREIGLEDQVIGRAYLSVEDVPLLTHDLNLVCRAILFTGRVPFARAVTDDQAPNAIMDYVPHSAIDLYRTLAIVMLQRRGRLPSVSIDTIDQEVVNEVFHDLGLTPTRDVLSLDTGQGLLRSSEEVVEFHVDAIRSGRVGLSLTCLGAVKDALVAQGLPVTRIEHSRSTLRQALTRAASMIRMAEVEESQAAVAVLRPLDGQRRRGAPPHVRSYAERLRGVARYTPEADWTVHTTFGAVKSVVLADSPPVPVGWAVGFGVGASAADAEANARRALALGTESHAPFTVLADGSVMGNEARRVAGYRLRETDPKLLAHAREVGLRSLTLARLAVALRKVDPTSFTARELAVAYGVRTRSAHRMLNSLEQAGIVKVRGVDGPPRAGRPQTVYWVDLDRLVPQR